MKRTIIAALAAITALSAGAATAQSYGHDRHHDRGGYSQDRRYEQRYDRYDRREYRRWSRGDRLPYEYRSSYYVNDYSRYGYRAPPRGYGYYRTDAGDIVMAAIATGVIVSILSH
jgi:Ni/Co efflux regulator RcnB